MQSSRPRSARPGRCQPERCRAGETPRKLWPSEGGRMRYDYPSALLFWWSASEVAAEVAAVACCGCRWTPAGPRFEISWFPLRPQTTPTLLTLCVTYWRPEKLRPLDNRASMAGEAFPTPPSSPQAFIRGMWLVVAGEASFHLCSIWTRLLTWDCPLLPFGCSVSPLLQEVPGTMLPD